MIYSYLEVIRSYRVLNWHLISDYKKLALGTENLEIIDKKLIKCLVEKKSKPNIVDIVSIGKTLFVGEGNFSFALSVISNRNVKPSMVVASSNLARSEIKDSSSIINIDLLEKLGVRVDFEVDAANLKASYRDLRFDNIVFQFPNVASREAIENRNPNFILVRDFLFSSFNQIKLDGKVIITVVDSSYYDGVFSFEEASETAGFNITEVYNFNPLDFDGYVHTMTNSDDSAIDNYNKFKTLVFIKK